MKHLAALQDENEDVRKEILAVLKKKYETPQIKNLPDAEMRTAVAECLQRIHIITGWNLPNDVSYMKILIDEFNQKLKEDFYMMNFSEIAYAFRKNGLGIIDWGKNMNLDLICNVLGNYCIERERISFEEERRMYQPPPTKIYTDEELDNFHRQWTEEFYQRIRNGNIEKVPVYAYEILVKDGLMKKDESVAAFFVSRLNANAENIYCKS